MVEGAISGRERPESEKEETEVGGLVRSTHAVDHATDVPLFLETTIFMKVRPSIRVTFVCRLRSTSVVYLSTVNAHNLHILRIFDRTGWVSGGIPLTVSKRRVGRYQPQGPPFEYSKHSDSTFG